MRLNGYFFFFFQAEDGIRDLYVTGVQTCALPICLGEQRGRHLEAEGAGGFQVDDKLESGGLHYRQIGDVRALEDSTRHDTGLMVSIGEARTIAHQAPACRKLSDVVDRGNPVLGCKCDELISPRIEEWVVLNDKGASSALDERREALLQLGFGAGAHDDQSPTEGASCNLNILCLGFGVPAI